MRLRRLLVLQVLALVVVGASAGEVTAPSVEVAHAHGPCGHLEAIAVLPDACAHEDEAPPGIDPEEPVSTSELRSRLGGGEGAYAAAEELGIAAPTSVAVASPEVPCDGDGTSGYRVQAMYVVEAGRTNRFAALHDSFQLWAAGTDDVVNRSAALTGGVRHLRYVTDPSGGSCVARVLNVTVPAGSLSSFNSSVAAVQALGYTDPARKYLMWTDATVLCGVASMYLNDNQAQGNPNNGTYAQYARVDSGCWGLGNGAAQHSVEAHEVLHTLGGVQNTAPHSTRAGHCWDESDTMCYPDGGGYPMQQLCPVEREYLFDCSNDDYFSTYPDPGSYLDGHWNAADSRFLIGGGDGSGGGDPGAPTVLGATIGVNNPAVPGLATQATVTPSLPAGRTIASVQWKSARADCGFSAPTSLQTEVQCAATASTSTTVTATIVDSTGATKSVTSPLTFATGGARPVTLALGAAGQNPAAGGTVAVCAGKAFPLTVAVVDTASGQPVKGLKTVVTKQTSTMTSPTSAGTPLTAANGIATLSQTATLATTYRGRTDAGTVYAAGAPVSLVAAPTQCTTAVTAGLDKTAVYYADPVTVSGQLTATAGGVDLPAAGVSLAVRLTTPAGKVLSLGTARTTASGGYSLVVKPTATGTISVVLAASTGYAAASATAGSVTVEVPATRLTGATDKTDVGYGAPIRVTGTLERVAGSTVTALASKAVSFYVTPAGGTRVRIGGATTTANGSFAASVPLKVSGTLSVGYAGAAGQPAATETIGPVVAGTWSTSLTASASASTVVAGGSFALTGVVTRTYAGATQPAPGVRVSVYFTPTGGSPTLVKTATTTTTGTYRATIYPKATGTWTARVVGVAGHADSAAPPVAVSVG